MCSWELDKDLNIRCLVFKNSAGVDKVCILVERHPQSRIPATTIPHEAL